MKTLVATLALVLVYQAQAQANQENIQSQESAVQAQHAVVQGEPNTIAPAQSAGNPIYILNNQRVQGYQGTAQETAQGAAQSQGQVAVQEQPVSVVQDTPLKVSPADQIRKRRADTELQTEDSIAQALEKARIDDEIRRREKFNNAIVPVQGAQAAQSAANNAGASVVGDNNSVQQTNVIQQPQQVQQAQAVQQVAPVKPAEPIKKIIIVEKQEEDSDDVVVVEKAPKKEKEEKVDVRAEIHAAIAESSKKQDLDRQSYYVSALASFGNYNNIVNVDRSLGWGLAVGTVLPEHFVVEGAFFYGTYRMQDICMMGCGPNFIVDMIQYNFEGALKYQILPGKFRPVVGAILGYTRRSYSYPNFGGSYRQTDAIDGGALLGADLALTSGFAIGLDFRYMTNFGYRVASSNYPSPYQQYNDPEKLDYYTINLVGKFTF